MATAERSASSDSGAEALSSLVGTATCPDCTSGANDASRCVLCPCCESKRPSPASRLRRRRRLRCCSRVSGDSDGPNEMGVSALVAKEEPASVAAPAAPPAGLASRRCGEVGTAAPTFGDGHRATASATRGASRTKAVSDSIVLIFAVDVGLDAIADGTGPSAGEAADKAAADAEAVGAAAAGSAATMGTVENGTG